MRPHEDIEQAMDAHGSTVWRVCVLYFRASADAQDAFQDTMVKYALADTVSFNDDEHRKAWLIRVAANTCKDMLKASSRANVPLDEGACGDKLVSCDEAMQPASFSSEVVDALRGLTDPPRTPLYLSLYEGYTAPEIATMVDAPVNTMYSWIARGKMLLKEALS
ncbi:RNA polymerase sigma factor [Gordonibacter pamelaeae]|uniref:RNA polymerase subunit sigma-24 n=1 Tax=Gordonibacter pamelaeae TaxID=471189 RepID=A0A369LRC3_9ACTN|nr:RNA polymerase sigma factor [Gordonibacter pamelaeae]RDB61684.1 RNA polymerase subunit sigma-24 [Gordonibacter pamelaeae]